MRADIERYLAGHPVQAPAVPVTPMEGTAFLPADTSPTGALPNPAYRPEEDEEPRRTGLWVMLAILLVALVAAAAFFVPQLLGEETRQVRVENVVGDTEVVAVETLEDQGFEVLVEQRADEEVRRNRVIEQDPDGETLVDEGTTVTIVVSTGKPEVEVPGVVDLSKQEATNLLQNRGFQVQYETRESDEEKDLVIDQDPREGEAVTKGSIVTLYLSDGQEEVPNVVGELEDDAIRILEDAGFEVFVSRTSDTLEPAGTVIRQSIVDETAPEGTQVTIEVSSFVPPTEPTEPTDTATTDPTDPTDPTDGVTDLLDP
jgi:beta-lactam-binding protein with PASTA domain